VLNVCRQLEKEGYDLVVIGVDGHGQLDLVQLAEALRTPTALVSTMAANNETGVTFPLEQIGELVKEAGALWHVDAVQMVGKAPIDLRSLPVDLLTLSAHKIHGPKGVGALYLRRGVRFQPFLLGGHQERGRRAGTENVAGVVGLGQAASEAREALQTGAIAAVGVLRDRLEVGLQALISDCVVNGVGTSRLANTSNIGFKYIEGESILFSLDSFGICASSGSACTSGSLEASHVLRAMAVPYTTLHGSIRFSLSRFTTAEEVDRVLELMPGVVQRLRDLSPFSDDDVAWLKQMELAPTNPKE
jgi:cysteine desulfurase